MKAKSKPAVDTRDADNIFKELNVRRSGYVPEWLSKERSAGQALQWIFSRYIQAIIQRLNQAPDKNLLAFLDTMGIDLVPAQAARAPVVFQLTNGAADTRIPAGTRVAAPPPPEGTDQIVFEIESTTGIAAANLVEVVSLWPGRDQYVDHSAEHLSGKPFQLFKEPKNIPHAIYIAHDTLLAFAGKARIIVEFDLTQLSSEHLDILWEYWDGKIWRGFKDMNPACGEDVKKLDATGGLTKSGKYYLETDCAETKKKTVNGIDAFWIRGRLTEPMPPDPGKILPEVDAIRLSSIINRPYDLKLFLKAKEPKPAQGTGPIYGFIRNEYEVPLIGVQVLLYKYDVTKGEFILVDEMETDNQGKYEFAIQGYGDGKYKVEVILLGFTGESQELTVNSYAPAQLPIEQDFNVLINVYCGIEGVKAYFNTTKLDLNKTFFPFGIQPTPGDIFYLGSEEAFSKPGASIRLVIIKAKSPQDSLINFEDVTIDPIESELVWEYWNGNHWHLLSLEKSDFSTIDSIRSGLSIINFVVPPDIARVKVNNEEGFWIRIRLLSGGFGFIKTVQFRIVNPNPPPVEITNEFKSVLQQPPAWSELCLGYTWQYGPFHAEHVLTYNDFQYEDRTYNAQWPGKTFQPFRPPADVTPTVYFGFDKKLPNDYFNLFFNIEEKNDQVEGPAMVWEYYDGSAWRSLLVEEDETGNLALPGMVSFIAPSDAGPLSRFAVERYWIRGRLKEDQLPAVCNVINLYHNAVRVQQVQTMTDERLGQSNGQPDQVFVTRYKPVLADEWIEVRELEGVRAHVEWRILARELFKGDTKSMEELEKLLNKSASPLLTEYGELRLLRDENRRVIGAWVRWQQRKHLFFSGSNDRHYMIDRAKGRIIFGDGEQGKIPPVGSEIIARKYRSGGGSVGNVKANEITQLLSGAAAVQGVFNPLPAEGGADTENITVFTERGPRALRYRDRALTSNDFETMAFEANPAVAVARALPLRDAQGRIVPGWITLIIIPKSDEPRPWPTAGLRRYVHEYIEKRASADLAERGHIHVTGPNYEPVGVSLIVAPINVSESGVVENCVRQAIQNFLHPLRGGAEGLGWEPGRDVFLSDVAAVVERVEGVDYVEDLALLQEGLTQGNRVRIAPDRITVAGRIFLKMKISE